MQLNEKYNKNLKRRIFYLLKGIKCNATTEAITEVYEWIILWNEKEWKLCWFSIQCWKFSNLKIIFKRLNLNSLLLCCVQCECLISFLPTNPVVQLFFESRERERNSISSGGNNFKTFFISAQDAKFSKTFSSPAPPPPPPTSSENWFFQFPGILYTILCVHNIHNIHA